MTYINRQAAIIKNPVLSVEAILYGPRPSFIPPHHDEEAGIDWYILPEHHQQLELKISKLLLEEIKEQKLDAVGNDLLSKDLKFVEKVIKKLYSKGTPEIQCRFQSSSMKPRSIWKKTHETKVVSEDMDLFAELLGVGRIRFQARHFNLPRL